MAQWNKPPVDRLQVQLYSPTLDESFAGDHPVRLFDEVLRQLNFKSWESQYVRAGAGQPAIHPRVMGGCILYGMSVGIRSSRKIEEACALRNDFIWLMEGRTPDHSTICAFRTRFEAQLKELFAQVGRLAMDMGLVRLNQITLDGTDIRANNSRQKTAHRPSLEKKLAVLDEQIEQAMAQAKQQDEAEDRLYGESSPTHLPPEFKDLTKRQAKLKEAVDRLEQMEKERQKHPERKSDKGPAVPLTDVDSRVLPNKSGGYAPNYTAVFAVDADSGIIVDTQVLGGNDEASTVLPAIKHIEENFGKKPEQLLADSGFNTGPNLAELQEKQVEPLMPPRQPIDASAALREDLSQPVAQEKREALPMNPQNKIIDKAAFIHDAQRDCYICPMGRTLEHVEDAKYDRHGVKGTYRIYESPSCADCPLASRCLPGKSTQRRVCRDEYESLREQMQRRMQSDEGKREYGKRSHVAETPHGAMKTKMNFRQFLLRGLTKAGQELLWVSTAYNIVKLLPRWALERARTALPSPASPVPG